MSPSPDAGGPYPTSAFDYELPPRLIAHHPAQRRDESRLMVVDRAAGTIQHRIFRDLPDYIAAPDALVLNETRVFPARLVGVRPGGGAGEVLLLRPAEGERAGWRDGVNREVAGTGEAERPGFPGDGEIAGGRDTENRTSERPDEAAAPGFPPSRSPALSPSLVRNEVSAGASSLWHALVRPGAKLRPGKRLVIAEELAVAIVGSEPDGTRIVKLETTLPVDVALERYGRVPLPPYIDREPEPEDAERYQTVYARERGSVAAPTAGLHFTPALLGALERREVDLVRLVLHVGVGTFRPVEVEDPAQHRMHAEWYRVPGAAAAAINRTRAAGGAIWCVGTTVTRTLETVADDRGFVQAGEGWTDIFIRPPYRFRVVDRLLTNFHLPRSTLLMLVSAFAGRELVLEAYREAVRREYRFFSYGDAMMIV